MIVAGVTPPQKQELLNAFNANRKRERREESKDVHRIGEGHGHSSAPERCIEDRYKDCAADHCTDPASGDER